MNILFYLLPKANICYLYEDFTIRQALEHMKEKRYSVVPIISRDGDYVGSISEGDILFEIRNTPDFNIKLAEKMNINNISILRSYKAININADMKDLILLSLDQNFVPVVDDRNKFIGIVTRKDIIKSFLKEIKEE